MTASQSSSVMLNSIRSRVIPALLTTMRQPAEAVGGRDELVGGAARADVARDGDALGAGRRDLVEDVGFVERARDVVDDDRRTRPGQADRLGTAQACGRTRHHRDQTGEIRRVWIPCSIYEYL